MIRLSQRWCGAAALALLVVLAAGCAAVGPDYRRPVIHTPDAWTEQVAEQVARGSGASLQTWWTVFEDPVLDDLIEQARNANLDLKIALSRVEQSRVVLAIATGEKLPVVNADAFASEHKASDDGTFVQVAPPGGFDRQGLYEIGLDAFWEIDVFGRVRRTIEAAGAGYEASVEDYRDVLVTLLAEVALSYVDVRSTQQRIELAQENAAAQAESLELTRDRFESGVTSKLDVVQAESNLAATRATIPQLRVALNQALNRLAVLLGRDAGSLQAEFSDAGPIPAARGTIGIAVPANVLRQRPDIRRAERLLAAQTAEIGVATADLYPTFGLSGLFGLQSRTLGNLVDDSSLTWGLKSQIQWNIFDRTRIRSNIRLQDEKAEELLLRYENKVVLAVEEVENAIMGVNLNRERREFLGQATAATMEAVELVVVQYDSGLTEFNNVLVTQRTLFQQQDQLAAADAEVAVDMIVLYKALGGGWDLDEAADSTPPSP